MSRDPYRFGPIRLDPAQRQLWVADVPAKVGARAFDLLLALVERRGREVTKAELLDVVWPGLVVEENNMQVHISALRKLLGPSVIATIPGRGYQFTATLDTGRDADVHAATAAAGASAPATAHNLPFQRTRFIGRDVALTECARMLGDARLLTVTGIGGCGKTRFALQLAQQRLAAHPDGIWFVDLSPLADSARVAHAVSAAIGVREESGSALTERLTAHLGERRVLLVLDNCEHVLDAAARLVDALLVSCAHLTIVTTSRENLGIAGEQVFYLRPLLLPAGADLASLRDSEAGSLFIERARQVLPEFDADEQNAAAITDICRRLDGIALAIELAAARTTMLSVQEICARLDDRFRLLTGGARGLPRHQTLLAALQWSHDSLGAEERHLFRRLAVFGGGCTLAAATHVAGAADEYAVLALLTQLHDKSLLEVDRAGAAAPRYRMLETVHQYAKERLDEAGEADAVRTLHLGYCLELAQQADTQIVGPDQGAWLTRLAQEQANLIAAHAWCDHAAGGDETGLRLVVALRHYWVTSDQVELGLELAHAALARVGTQVDAQTHCAAHLAINHCLFFLGRYDDALRHAEHGLALARTFDHAQILCRALAHRAQTLLAMAQPMQAIADYEEACEIARQLGPSVALASVLNGLAEAHRGSEHFAAAEAFHEEAVKIGREVQSPGATAPPMGNLVRVLITRGALERARSLLLECATIVMTAGLTAMAEQVLEIAAGLAASQNDPVRAARFYGASNALLQAAGRHREPVDEAFIAPLMTRCRTALGNDEFAAAEGAAHELGFDASLAEVQQWLRASTGLSP